MAGAVFGLAFVCTVIPVGFMMHGQLHGPVWLFWRPRDVDAPPLAAVLAEPRFVRGAGEQLHPRPGHRGDGVLLYSVMAYITVRTKFAARWAFDVLTWIPFTIPGIILGLAYLLFVIQTPLMRPLYGSMALLVVVSTLSVMTITMQLLKSNMLQLSFDLEEAVAHARRHLVVHVPAHCGAAARSRRCRRGHHGFATAARQVSVIVPLTTGQTEPLAVLQLGYLMAENRSAASVVGTIIVVLTVSAALLVRALGRRAGIHA